MSSETKDIVKLGMGLVGTMAALVLGLLVASAKGFYDTQGAEVTQLAANVALLDRVLAHCRNSKQLVYRHRLFSDAFCLTGDNKENRVFL